MEKDRKLNWRQACVMLGCGKTKFYELINSGMLQAYRVGKRGTKVKESDILALERSISEQPSLGNSENTKG